jgi:hypothetical protein
LFLDFGLECGLIGDLEHEHLATGCWEALREVALAQANHHAATEPTARFLGLLRASLTSGRAHLQARDGGMPDKAAACGWRLSSGSNWSPHGDCVGWVDGDDLFLEPTASYRVVQLAARDTAEPFSISEQTLKKRLHEKGLLATIDQRREMLAVRRTLAGSSRAVLHLLRSTLLPEAPDEEVAE